MKSLQFAMIPDDENGDVLRAMLEDGDDLTIPREIDFHLVFGDEAAARAFVAAVNERPDLIVSVPGVDDEGIWQVTASRHMVPRHADITKLEHELTALAESFGGYPDGWECSRAAGPVDGDDAVA
ncbi:ribonuclease E inhibitor RraB [Cognatilysobacter terrigena]|uniref:ribonuclease E inhibitor RraB n=1 Tax=Cognatilysobacter terrigena TaxID=2488749 RepID=UPI001AAC8417|nr:ribonuclease E inhibitor RraB [Lysobacter terrigena]